jgi:CRP/FNR family transcriptional regulator, nitrogen oxide reductase regulator
MSVRHEKISDVQHVLRPKPTPLLVGLDGSTADVVLHAAREKTIAPKQTILTSGETATHLFLVREGTVRYYKPTRNGDEVLLDLLVAGDVFGLGTLLRDPPPYLGSAETVCESRLFVWGHPQMRRLAKIYPQLAENALCIVLQYLKIFAERHVGVVTKTADRRLAHALLGLAHRTGKITSSGVEVGVTNERLAGLADISSFTASRLLSSWARRGLISKARKRVFVHVPEALPFD